MQWRKLKEDHINDLIVAFNNRTPLPPIVIFKDRDSKFWLADGHHRVEAATRLGNEDISCDIRIGSKREAKLHSICCNNEHGLKPTPHEKNNMAAELLLDAAWTKKTDTEISKMVGMGQSTISKMRRSINTIIRMVELEQIIDPEKLSLPKKFCEKVIKAKKLDPSFLAQRDRNYTTNRPPITLQPETVSAISKKTQAIQLLRQIEDQEDLFQILQSLSERLDDEQKTKALRELF
ncbi:MAG: ParB N-terminal domain-containing protein [Planktothrix sp.]